MSRSTRCGDGWQWWCSRSGIANRTSRSKARWIATATADYVGGYVTRAARSSTKRCWHGSIAGAVKWYQNGQEMPEPPASVEAAKETWRTQVDVLLRYMADELVPDPKFQIAGVNIYRHCAEWRAARHTVWSDQTFAARFGEHPRMQAKGIEKKQIRKKAQGQTRSHRDVWVNGKLWQAVPDRYWAWVGVRFRDSTDAFGPGDTNGW